MLYEVLADRDNRDNRNKGDNKGDGGGGDGGANYYLPTNFDPNNPDYIYDDILFFRYKGPETVTLKADIKGGHIRNTGSKSIRNSKGFINTDDLTDEDYQNFMPLLLSNVVDPNKIHLFNIKAAIKDGKDKDKVVTLIIKPQDYFGLIPDPNEPRKFLIISPYTSLYFGFSLRDEGSFRYQEYEPFNKFKRVARKDKPLSMLLDEKRSEPLGRLYKKFSLLKRAVTQFDFIVDRIAGQIKSQVEQKQRKKANFKFRHGDVVTGIKGSEENYLLLETIANKNNNTLYHLLVRDDGNNFSYGDLELIENTRLYDTPPHPTDPIKAHIDNVKYVYSVENSVLDRLRNNPEMMNNITNILQKMGLTTEDIYKDAPRNWNNEIPPSRWSDNKDEKKGKLTEGKLIYLPDGIPYTFESGISREYTSTEIKNEPNAEVKKALEQVYDLNKGSGGSATIPIPTIYPDSKGWYIIVDRKNRTSDSTVDWTLMPWPSGKITAVIPIKGKETRENTGKGAQQRTRISIGHEKVSYDHVTVNLDTSGSRSLPAIIEQPLKDTGKEALIRDKSDTQAFKQAKQTYENRDKSGNIRKVMPGDIIRWSGVVNDTEYYVANRKDKDNRVTMLLIPLAAFTDISKNEFRPFKFYPGGTSAIGYKNISFSKDRETNNVDKEARKLATEEQLRGSGILNLAIDYYRNHNEDGTPRDRPLNIDQMTVFQKFKENTEKFKSDEKVTFDNDLMSGKSKGEDKDRTRDEVIQDEYEDTLEDRNVSRDEVKEGMLIEYDWGNKITTEIYFGKVDNNHIRLVPHAEFEGKPDGVVPTSGYNGLVSEYENVTSPGFWHNYHQGVYTNPASRHSFDFADSFEENFSQVLKAAGISIPEVKKDGKQDLLDSEKESIAEAIENRKKALNSDEGKRREPVVKFFDSLLGKLNNTTPDKRGNVAQYQNNEGKIVNGIVIEPIKNENDIIENKRYIVLNSEGTKSLVKLVNTNQVTNLDSVVNDVEYTKEVKESFLFTLDNARHHEDQEMYFNDIVKNFYKENFKINL